jgi:predicted GIY-YIG superfamily endonuclease
MNLTPKTIQIFLPGGDPRGIRIAEITTRIVQVIEIPRKLLPEFLSMPQSNQVALYFLFGATEDDFAQQVYIGQTGDLRARLAKHNKEKAFWERALVLISRTDSLTQTHALYLEWHCLQAAREADRYANANGNGGSKPHTPAPLEADCLEVFDTGRTLLATLGYPIFDSIVKSSAQTVTGETATLPLTDDEVFYCKGSDADGRGLYTSEGFVVLKGSSGRKDVVASSAGTSREQLRMKLLQAQVLRVEGDRVVFQKDHLFPAPSAAAIAVQGRNANGWTEWRTKDGRTLDEVKRQTTTLL